MSKGKVTPFKGSKLHIQTSLGTPTAISEITAANPGKLKSTIDVSKGDVIEITGTDDFDGAYVVTDTGQSDEITINADWSGKSAPDSYTEVKATDVKFSSDWCELTGVDKTGGTVDQIEVSSICSTRKEYESGLADAGTLQFNFNFAPATTIQKQLQTYETSGEKFWSRLILPKEQGTMLYYGGIQTGANMSGAVNGVFTAGVTIQLSGDYYHVEAA